MFDSTPALPLQVSPRRTRKRRRVLLIAGALLLACLVCLAAAAGWFWSAARKALPELDGVRQLAGLVAPVTVVRDSQGVPAITANSLDDLFFAQGYVTAQDRLWQMDMSRRYASGELSEVLGAGYIKTDTAQRILRLRQVAEAAASRLSARDRTYFECYARGVNAYIAEHQHSLPLEFRVLRYFPRAWTPTDSFLVGAMMSEMLNHYGYRDELEHEKFLARLGPELTADLFPVSSGRDIVPGHDEIEFPPAPEAESSTSTRRPSPNTLAAAASERALTPGSNNWVISGSHTASGKPLLSNDMHLPHRIPNTWYEAHLICGEYDVAGVTLPGLPFVVVGHNQRIAWGFTNLGPDVEDLYIESFNSQGEYLTPDGWKKPEVLTEVIRVKGGKEVSVNVTLTRHGPIITPSLEGERRQLALRWTIYDPSVLSYPFFNINSARNWEEFRQALSQFGAPGQNVVYADVDGHIGYQATGFVPIRAAGDGSLPVNGSDNEHEWTGYIPFDQMPRAYDPPSGIIATANGRVTPDDYPYLITTDWGSPYRTERIHRLLEARKQFTPGDMLAMQTDVYSDLDHFLAERFVYAVDHRPKASARSRQAAELLRGWDGRMSADSAAAAIERTARATLYTTLLESKLGSEAESYTWFNSGVWLENVVLRQLPRWLPGQYGSYEEMLADSIEKAVNGPHTPRELAKWSYGESFPVEIAHPLFGSIPYLKRWAGPGLQPQSGDDVTVKQVGRNFGPSQRLTVDFADLDASTLNIVNGQSGNLFSQYFNNQWTAWRDGTTYALPFTPSAVARSQAHLLVLRP